MNLMIEQFLKFVSASYPGINCTSFSFAALCNGSDFRGKNLPMVDKVFGVAEPSSIA